MSWSYAGGNRVVGDGQVTCAYEASNRTLFLDHNVVTTPVPTQAVPLLGPQITTVTSLRSDHVVPIGVITLNRSA